MENLACKVRESENHSFMKTMPITENTLNRLARAIMERQDVGYQDALSTLSKFHLNLVCDKSIVTSNAMQAALLTAVNTGKRAFHGGVFVSMPANVPCIVPWPTDGTLNHVVSGLGGYFAKAQHTPFSHTLYFGKPINPVPEGLAIICSGWRGGVASAENPITLPGRSDFALGGVLAAALGVAKGFLRVSGLSSRHIQEAQGFSLWKPDVDWTLPEADGPPLELLPKNLWMLGLGHLGQAYLWNLGLLPFSNPSEVNFLLQDFDHVVKANLTSGLLCEETCLDRRKTRVCAEWLEARRFQTTITERAFDTRTRRTGDEPFIALCGFDSADARRGLEETGFDLVIECGLGADADRFDRIILHTFPDASQTASQRWPVNASIPKRFNSKIVDAFRSNGDCGILAETLAQKAVSTSFVGAFAGALAVAELLRALNGGVRCELIHAQLRNNDAPKVVMKAEQYLNRVARSGYQVASLNRF